MASASPERASRTQRGNPSVGVHCRFRKAWKTLAAARRVANTNARTRDAPPGSVAAAISAAPTSATPGASNEAVTSPRTSASSRAPTRVGAGPGRGSSALRMAPPDRIACARKASSPPAAAPPQEGTGRAPVEEERGQKGSGHGPDERVGRVPGQIRNRPALGLELGDVHGGQDREDGEGAQIAQPAGEGVVPPGERGRQSQQQQGQIEVHPGGDAQGQHQPQRWRELRHGASRRS